ncbi:uncharacterized protein LOC125721593 isoform X2 [Brienomyrus brachyistius]|uniref:uncharacterized protein LOC125721593 isoform X2 n=1 Tax=Brienomyrus brachyistius TaxID=42636 RepID=UPI0020B23A13|nr:uncharacterized protein LOC125721593 isoform X2 [Brienomyrus brachyistius]
MAGNVPAPPMFLPCPGEPPIPFDMWLRIFKNYLLVINATGNAWPEARRRATLLHCLGTEGQRTFYSLPDTGDSFDSAVTALEKHYTPKVNVVVERHTFRQRKQAPHETIIQYAAVLRDLASKCGFDDKTDEMIRDQLIEHVNNSNIRERLLLESDLTLDKTLTLASQVESAIQQAKTITGNDSVPVQAVQPRSQFTKKKYTQHIHPNKPFNASTTSSRSCFRCGSNTHLANSSQCPAAKATCKSCHKVGHFARVCRSSKTSDVREIQLPKLTVLYLNNTCHAPHTLTCKINISTPASLTKEHEMVVDTGSAVSILPHHIYVQYFNDTPLLPPVSQLVTYTRKRIPVLGCLQVKVSRGVLTAPVTFYVVKKGTSLLGRDLMKALSICIEGNTILPPVFTTNSASAPCIPTAPAVSCVTVSTASCIPTTPDIGCAQNFVHKVKIDPTVKPVRQKLRRLPFAVRASVSAELDRLLKAGVIEKIDASPWVSPIVVTGRKTGGIRMCTDLREPNKAVVTDCYPLPHVDELLANLQEFLMASHQPPQPSRK